MNNNSSKKNNPGFILQQYNIARGNLLLMAVFTVANVVLFIAGSDSMLLFSATVPYFATVFGIATEVRELAVAGIVIAAVIILVYLLCWLFSKKHYGWMIAALVLFSIDTLVLAALYILSKDVSGIFDAIIHAWVLYYLIFGVINGAKLSKIPPEEIELAEETYQQPEANATPLRVADNDVKFRILIEGDFIGHHIAFRRVKRVNELVVDGSVYDEIEMLAETAHQLNAVIDGHDVSVGYDGFRSYISIDGKTVAKKIRLI